MTVAALFPTPAEVEANTPATRDRAIDVIRLEGPGLYCVAAMLAALVGARYLATGQHAADQRVCAASLPASTR